MARVDAAGTSRHLGDRAGELAEALLGAPSHRGRSEWRWGSRGSLALVTTGQKSGLWRDHERGEGGDLLALIRRERRCSFPDALAWALAWLGKAPAFFATPERPPPIDRPPLCDYVPTQTRELARRLWRESVRPAGTPVEAYLARRGLTVPDRPDDPRVIRFHPACPRGGERHPAMLALMTEAESNRPRGIHRTFLLPDGSDRLRDGMGKAMLGNAGVIRLSPDGAVTMGLGIAEGIESALSVMQRAGWRPVWAASSAGAIRTFPILPAIEALTIFADADGPGIEAARTCATRWRDAGREARVIAPPEGDWNDAVRAA
jgi:hypothetical protein